MGLKNKIFQYRSFHLIANFTNFTNFKNNFILANLRLKQRFHAVATFIFQKLGKVDIWTIVMVNRNHCRSIDIICR